MRATVLGLCLALLGGCGEAPQATGAGGAPGATSAVDDPSLPSRFHKPISQAALEPALFDEVVLIYVNRARAAARLAPYRAEPSLARAAQGHAANMAHLRIHSHRLPIEGEARLIQRITRQGVRYKVAGENIGMEKLYRLTGRPISIAAEGCRFTYADTRDVVPLHTYATLAQAAVARWMASPPHRASILRRDFARMGSGFGIDPKGPACGDVYLVQNFAG